MGTRRERRRAVLSLLGGLAAACCALAIFFEGVGNLDQNSGERSRRHAVFYQVEGSNLMPDITVLERET